MESEEPFTDQYGVRAGAWEEGSNLNKEGGNDGETEGHEAEGFINVDNVFEDFCGAPPRNNEDSDTEFNIVHDMLIIGEHQKSDKHRRQTNDQQMNKSTTNMRDSAPTRKHSKLTIAKQVTSSMAG